MTLTERERDIANTISKLAAAWQGVTSAIEWDDPGLVRTHLAEMRTQISYFARLAAADPAAVDAEIERAVQTYWPKEAGIALLLIASRLMEPETAEQPEGQGAASLIKLKTDPDLTYVFSETRRAQVHGPVVHFITADEEGNDTSHTWVARSELVDVLEAIAGAEREREHAKWTIGQRVGSRLYGRAREGAIVGLEGAGTDNFFLWVEWDDALANPALPSQRIHDGCFPEVLTRLP